MKRIVLAGAPPLTGKTSLLDKLAKLLGPAWIPLDNEVNGFPMSLRIKCAEASGLEINSPDFVRMFNLPGQLAYQASARSLASRGHNVVMTGPFEDLTPMIGEYPLLTHMQNVDFKDFDLKVVHVVVWPEGCASTSENILEEGQGWEAVEAEMQRRREARDDDGGPQSKLDADKHGDDYYRLRVQKILRTSEMFDTPIVKVGIEDDPVEMARVLTRQIARLYN